MGRLIRVRRRVLIAVLVVGTALCATSCETTFPESSGELTNQRSSPQSHSAPAANYDRSVFPSFNAAAIR